MKQTLLFTNHVAQAIDDICAEMKPTSVYVHVDTNTSKFVLPIIESQSSIVAGAVKIISPAGDVNKNVESLQAIWKQLSDNQASRSALFINLGGGVVSDLGGFAAATFKRGLNIVNIPTTLLGAVDAAEGGKTGINFAGFKNQVGAFYEANAVIISTIFFETLTQYEMLSGYAEMIKHGLLKDEKAFNDILSYSLVDQPYNNERLLELLRESVLVKKNIVEQDPTETGLRKALNLGHTIGHALESLAIYDRHDHMAHGFAVAQGLVVETILSHMLEGFDSASVHKLAKYVRDNYTPYMITCDDYPALISYMRQDKKNADANHINFTLLKAPGEPVLNVTASEDDIKNALDIYRDLMGL